MGAPVKSTILLVALFVGLFADFSVAHAAPTKAHASPKEAFTCELVDVAIWGAPDGSFGLDHFAAVQVRCTNTGKKSLRIKASDVWLVDTSGDRHRPETGDDNFCAAFDGTDPRPEFVDGFIDVAQGSTTLLGFTFRNSPASKTGLVIDINGVKLTQK